MPCPASPAPALVSRRAAAAGAIQQGHPAAGAELDAAGAGSAGGEGERDVAALPHRARVVEQGGGDEQGDGRVAHAERLEALELLGELEAEGVAGGDGVDPLAGDEVL